MTTLTTTEIRNFIAGRGCPPPAMRRWNWPIPQPANPWAEARPGRPPRWMPPCRRRTRLFPGGAPLPAGDRVQFLFKLKALLEEHLEELARS